MMKTVWLGLLCGAMLVWCPSLAYAKRIPLFFNTGDELFEIQRAPRFEDGYSLGYACKRFGLFWADVWTWDCELMAVNLKEFSVVEVPPELSAEYAKKYSLKDRKRNVWNHYGVAVMVAALLGMAVVKMRQS